uniref:F-box/kelch-repeat protein n=1 Tax=Noccaea caerulescens TaxID=107243 RepID=A0A1J3JWE8_NOCCA
MGLRLQDSHVAQPPSRDSVVRDEKVYAVDGKESVFYYSPKEGKWGRGNRGETIRARQWCMVDDVLYCISATGTRSWIGVMIVVQRVSCVQK